MFVPSRLYRRLRPVARPALLLRGLQLHLGLALLGLALATMVEAGVGMGPWGVLHVGLAEATGLSFGRTVQLVGIVVVALAWALFRVRPGGGTLVNMLLVGPWADLFLAQAWLPRAAGWPLQLLQFAVGVALVGFATGMYVAARLGAGPRDGFVLGAAARLGRSVRRVRTGLELLVLALGALLGGPIGLGTLLFALLVGPAMQASLRLFRYRPAAPPLATPGD